MASAPQLCQIEPATIEDLPQLCGLLGILFTQEADFHADAARQERGLRLILEQPAVGRIFCARRDGAVLGMVSLLLTVSTAEGGRAAWVEDMVVLPDHRSQGLGERLLRHAIAEARALGCSRLTLLTDATNAGAMRFYERSGFVRSHMLPYRLGLANEPASPHG